MISYRDAIAYSDAFHAKGFAPIWRTVVLGSIDSSDGCHCDCSRTGAGTASAWNRRVELSKLNGRLGYGEKSNRRQLRVCLGQGDGGDILHRRRLSLTNEKNAKAAGVLIGAYHFCRPDLDTGTSGADNENKLFS